MNQNLVWAVTLVEELAANGLQAVCIAPGSRSTPLTLAFARHPHIDVYLHLDERSASFAALGMALATDRPVALVCTSGTAAAEFFAAIIEARQSQVPLLVLTADRPPELRQSGANQTIDQVKLYGDQVLWSVDVALPEAEPPAIALDNLRTLAARAYATANGMVKGPVHLNLPFRKPLEPASLDEVRITPRTAPATRMTRGRLLPEDEQVATLRRLLEARSRGIIVCGPGCPDGDFPEAVAALARHIGYPIMADPLSGLRYGPQIDTETVVTTYESLLHPTAPAWPGPDVVLRFGAVPTSKWLNEYLVRSVPAATIHVRASGIWADDSHRVTHFLQADEAATCCGLLDGLAGRPQSWRTDWARAEAAAHAEARRYFGEQAFDAAYVAAVLDEAPAGANIFVGNSLPIRHVDQFGGQRAIPLRLFGNRGASGIDGTTSTALGIAAAEPTRPLIFLTGDVAFYHDMNGLLALGQQRLENVTIVLLNNNGGGIFRRLPVAALDPVFTEFFITPHELDFGHAAALYGMTHRTVADLETFRLALNGAIRQPSPALIEIQTDSQADLQHQRELVRRIGASLREHSPSPCPDHA
jgi:2-succinyl-5-enolpyruvyl-6-hydroxy-3-cyclohexene-1-carboxylate synthase